MKLYTFIIKYKGCMLSTIFCFIFLSRLLYIFFRFFFFDKNRNWSLIYLDASEIWADWKSHSCVKKMLFLCVFHYLFRDTVACRRRESLESYFLVEWDLMGWDLTRAKCCMRLYSSLIPIWTYVRVTSRNISKSHCKCWVLE